MKDGEDHLRITPMHWSEVQRLFTFRALFLEYTPHMRILLTTFVVAGSVAIGACGVTPIPRATTPAEDAHVLGVETPSRIHRSDDDTAAESPSSSVSVQATAESPFGVTGVHIGEKPSERPSWWGPQGPIPELMPEWLPVGDAHGFVIGYTRNPSEYWALPPNELTKTTPPDRDLWDEGGTTVIGCKLEDGTYAVFGSAEQSVTACES